MEFRLWRADAATTTSSSAATAAAADSEPGPGTITSTVTSANPTAGNAVFHPRRWTGTAVLLGESGRAGPIAWVLLGRMTSRTMVGISQALNDSNEFPVSSSFLSWGVSPAYIIIIIVNIIMD